MSSSSEQYRSSVEVAAAAHDAFATDWNSIVEHPLVTAIGEGSCPRDVLRTWAAQKFCQQREFASNLAIVFSRMPAEERAFRSALAGNLYGERDHTDLYLRFGAGIGLSEETLWRATPFWVTEAFNDHLYRMVREGSLAVVAAAVHVGLEGVTTKHFPTVARGLRSHYGVDEGALEFFTAHDEADADHFEYGVQLLDHLCQGWPGAVAAALAEGRKLVQLYARSYTACWETRALADVP